MPHSTRRRRPPGVLRHAPVYPFQQISQLRRRNHHPPGGGRRPKDPAPVQPLRVEAHALAVMPQHLDQRAASTTEHEQMTTVGIMLELLLHQQRQAVEPFTHVGVAAGKPDPDATRDRNHRRRLARVSALISADTIAPSTGPVIRIRPPVANSTSIALLVTGAADPDGSGAPTTVTAEKPGADRAGPHNWRRHRKNWLVAIPAARATSDATAPGSIAAATKRSFSARDQRRRRSTDVITSTCVLVIGLSIGIVL